MNVGDGYWRRNLLMTCLTYIYVINLATSKISQKSHSVDT